MFEEMTIGFIGSGNMGEAMIHGLVSQNLVAPGQILTADPREERLQELHQRYGVRTTTNNLETATEADRLVVRLEGLYLTATGEHPLIARTAINRIEIINCTLDPRIQTPPGEPRTATPSIVLHEPYGFHILEEEIAFDQTPEIVIQRSITGPLRIDTGYRLSLAGTIIDAARGISDPVGADEESCALAEATEPEAGWGPPTHVEGITVFGRMRVERIHGQGGIWVHALEVLNDQVGCIKFSYFSDHGDQPPQSHACVSGADARLHFTSETFGDPAYGQFAHTTDFRIRERGSGDDAMGAFGFLKRPTNGAIFKSVSVNLCRWGFDRC